MPMDDLYKALGMFQQGVQQYAISSGVADAAQQLEQITQSNLDFASKRAAQTQLAQQTALRLMGAGANAEQVGHSMALLGPAPIKDAQDAFMIASQTGDPQAVKFANELQKFEIDRATAGVQLQTKSQEKIAAGHDATQMAIAGMKGDSKVSDKNMTYLRLTSADLENKVKTFNEGLSKAKTAIEQLRSGNPISDTSSINAFVKASGDTGVITDSDRKAFLGGSWQLKMKRALSQSATGKFDDETRGFLIKLGELYEKRANEQIDGYVNRYSAKAAKFTGMHPDEAKQYLYSGAPSVVDIKAKQDASAVQQQVTPPQQPDRYFVDPNDGRMKRFTRNANGKWVAAE